MQLFGLRYLRIQLKRLLLVAAFVIVLLSHQTCNLFLSCALMLQAYPLLRLLEFILKLTVLATQDTHFGLDLVHADPEGAHHLTLIQGGL